MVRWLIRAAVTAVVVVVLLRIVPLAGVLAAVGRTSAWTWTGTVVVILVGHTANGVKLRLLLGPASASLSTCLRAQFAALVANLGMPGLAGGDLVRGAYVASSAGAGRAAVAVIADRLIDTIVIAMLVGIALPVAGMPAVLATVMAAARWWVLAAIGTAVALSLAVALLWRTAAISARMSETWIGVRAMGWSLAGAFAISAVVQTVFVLANVWLGRQAGVSTGLAPWFVAWPLSKLVAVLPVSLGGIGVREAALVSLLVPYGAPREAVLASGLLWQAAIVVTSLIGLALTQMLPVVAVPDWGSIKSPAQEL